MASPVTVTRLLGIAGLVPFVAPALLALSGSALAAAAVPVAAAYALAIICFLCGSWWGAAQASGERAGLLLSNIYLLLSLGIYLFASDWWPLAAALLLLGAWLCEHFCRWFASDYRRMRGLLTLVAGGSMAAIQLAG